MPNKLRALRDELLGTLWFVPAAIVAAALLLAIGMVELSVFVDDDALAKWPLLFGASANSSRSILSAIASGMITISGLTFSLTMVAVTQASAQYTPRILRNFMSDRVNQLVLGTFVGIFVYCLVVLRTIRGVEERAFVPSLAVVLGIVLAIVGIGVLIYAVHHFATMLQASSIIARVANETIGAIDRLFPSSLGDEARDDAARAARQEAAVGEWRAVNARTTGYVQTLDESALLAHACESERLIRMERGLGDFVVEGLPIASYDADGSADHRPPIDHERLAAAIAGTFTIGHFRTVNQDAAFGVRQLVDIAVRALSPGVNDTTTAVGCVDYLGAILIRLSERRIEAPMREADGKVRIIARGSSFDSIVRLAFDEIRQNSQGNVSLLRRLFETITMVAAKTVDPWRCALLAEQAALVSEVAERTVESPHDRERLREHHRAAVQACASRASRTSRIAPAIFDDSGTSPDPAGHPSR